jgi:membrane protease YdiL (CAAX protease family)
VTREALALTWAMVFPSLMTWVYFVAVAGQGTEPNQAVLAAYGAGKFLQFAFPAVYVGWTQRQSLRPTWPTWHGLAVGVAFGLTVGMAALGVYFGGLNHSSMMRQAPDKILAKLRELGRDSVLGYVQMALFLCVLHSLLEEYYWRWFVFGWLKRHIRPWTAIVLASLAFMAHHVIVLAVFFPGLKQFLVLVIPFSLAVASGGGVWCWMYHRTGSLYAPWISHILIDGALMVIGYDLVADRL